MLLHMRLSDKRKIGLVLSGGGVKAAAFHIGVCLALREKGFKFAGGSPARVKHEFEDSKMTVKTYVGSSAGSVICGFLAAGYSLESIIHAFTKGAGLADFVKRKRTDYKEMRPLTYSDLFAVNVDATSPSRLLPSIFNKRPTIAGGLEVMFKQAFKVNGVFTMRNLERYMREAVLEDNQFASLGVELYVVATQLNHSRKVIFGNFAEIEKTKNIMHANFATISESIAASASLPPIFSPYMIKDNQGRSIHFFDGEIRDTLSTDVGINQGCDLVIASYSTMPYHYNEQMGSLHEYGMPLIFNQALYQLIEQKIQKHREHVEKTKTLVNAVNGYMRELNMPEEHIAKMNEILYSKTGYKPDVTTIYIHPQPQDHEMFFYDHFSLNPAILARIAKTGFRSAVSTLRKFNIF